MSEAGNDGIGATTGGQTDKPAGENRFENIPFQSPVVPTQLGPNSRICFNCYPGIS